MISYSSNWANVYPVYFLDQAVFDLLGLKEDDSFSLLQNQVCWVLSRVTVFLVQVFYVQEM
jgi:hypothetical protein